jgi:hypothetical protein
MLLVLVPCDLGGPLEASQLLNRVYCDDLPLLGGSHGVHRAAELEVVEAAGSNGERSRGGEGCAVRPGVRGALGRGRGITLSIIVRQLPYVPLSLIHRRSLQRRRFRGSGELRGDGGLYFRIVTTYRKRARGARSAHT